MKPIDYEHAIQDTLDAIGSPEGALGSGAAVALTLSVAIECLALQLALTTKHSARPENSGYYSDLGHRLSTWRARTRRLFVEDSAHFGAVIRSRIQRDQAPDEEKPGHVKTEMEHLELANTVLLSLLDLSLRLKEDGDLMAEIYGTPRAEGEAVTASFLAEAATGALASMLTSNLRSARKRQNAFGIEMGGRTGIREMVSRIPPGTARDRLNEEAG